MKNEEFEKLAQFYRNYLNEQIIPFWLNNSVDWEYGGIYNDVNIEGYPFGGIRAGTIASLKLWWQHTEALHGLLLAYSKTLDNRFLDAYKLTHDFCKQKFDDPNGPEWFSILDPQGNLINPAKGNERKSAFHIVRNFLWNLKLLENQLIHLD